MHIPGPTAILGTALVAGAVGAFGALWVVQPGVDAPSETRQTPGQAAGPAGLASFADAVARMAPAVVSIYAPRAPETRSVPGDPFAQYGSAPSRQPVGGREAALGSGVILSGDGLILTNRHVVKDAARIRAVLADGRSLEVRILGLDPDTDLAVLKADAIGLPSAPVGDPRALRVGDLALAIGNPFGIGQTVTQGIVSATGRAGLGLTLIERYIQTDAAINPGSSGGALVNVRGELVGINTAGFSEPGTAGGIGFSIPSDLALAVARAIVARGRVERGWLGLSGRHVTPGLAETFGLRAPGGVLVSSTLPDSPAERAGLRPGDVVTRVGDRDVRTLDELLDAVAVAGPHRPLTLEVWRGSERLQASAVTQARPAVGD